MIKFSELDIKVEHKSFSGQKIDIDKIINREIVVDGFKIEDSKLDKKKGNGKCLTLSFSLGESKHILFTSGVYLQEQILKVPTDKFPFTTTIEKFDKALKFT